MNSQWRCRFFLRVECIVSTSTTTSLHVRHISTISLLGIDILLDYIRIVVFEKVTIILETNWTIVRNMDIVTYDSGFGWLWEIWSTSAYRIFPYRVITLINSWSCLMIRSIRRRLMRIVRALAVPIYYATYIYINITRNDNNTYGRQLWDLGLLLAWHTLRCLIIPLTDLFLRPHVVCWNLHIRDRCYKFAILKAVRFRMYLTTYVFTKYLRANHFWIDDITFAHTCVTEAQDFLDDRFSGDLNFGRYNTLREKRQFCPRGKSFSYRIKGSRRI